MCHQWSPPPDPRSRHHSFHMKRDFVRFWKLWTDLQIPRVKIVITTGRDCGSAEWINMFLSYEVKQNIYFHFIGTDSNNFWMYKSLLASIFMSLVIMEFMLSILKVTMFIYWTVIYFFYPYLFGNAYLFFPLRKICKTWLPLNIFLLVTSRREKNTVYFSKYIWFWHLQPPDTCGNLICTWISTSSDQTEWNIRNQVDLPCLKTYIYKTRAVNDPFGQSTIHCDFCIILSGVDGRISNMCEDSFHYVIVDRPCGSI